MQADDTMLRVTEPDILTVAEAAQFLRVSTSQLYDLTRARGRARQTLPIPTIRLANNCAFAGVVARTMAFGFGEPGEKFLNSDFNRHYRHYRHYSLEQVFRTLMPTPTRKSV
jgi:hypothetical protein